MPSHPAVRPYSTPLAQSSKEKMRAPTLLSYDFMPALASRPQEAMFGGSQNCRQTHQGRLIFNPSKQRHGMLERILGSVLRKIPERRSENSHDECEPLMSGVLRGISTQ